MIKFIISKSEKIVTRNNKIEVCSHAFYYEEGNSMYSNLQ